MLCVGKIENERYRMVKEINTLITPLNSGAGGWKEESGRREERRRDLKNKPYTKNAEIN